PYFLMNRLALALVFTLSFMSYMKAELSTSLQIAPVALFAVLVFCRLLWSHSTFEALLSLLEPDGLLYVLFVSVFVVATSLASSSDNSFATALLISICVLLARV